MTCRGWSTLTEDTDVDPALRLDILIDGIAVAGSEIQTVRLAQGLAERGHEVRLVTLAERPARPFPEQEAAEEAGVQFVWSAEGGRSRAAAIMRALRIVRAGRPQVLYAVLTRSGMVSVLLRGISPRIRVVVARRYHPASVKWARRLLREIPVLFSNAVVANSRAAVADPLSRAVIGRSTCVVVPNQLAAGAFVKVPPLDAGTGPVVSCIANLREGKGHRDLLQAAARLNRRGMSVNLLLAGDGVLRAPLTQLAQELGVRVRLLGTVLDVRPLLGASDVVVQASLSEGLPNALVEAMAQGSAIVATDVGGTRELLGDAGILVPPSSPVLLAAAIERVLQDSVERERMRAKALRRAHELCDQDPVDAYERVFRQLAAART